MIKKDWPNIGSLVLSIGITLFGVAAAWGTARAQVANVIEQVSTIQSDLNANRDEISELKTDKAVTQVVEKNISDKLTEIDKKLESLDKKIDQLQTERRNAHGNQEANKP